MSTTTMPKLSKEVLHNALIANGVTPAATIPEMTAQLHAAAAAGRKKPGPKPKAPKGGGVTFNVDLEEVAFYASEKPILMAAGMTDPTKIASELRRRYMRMKGMSTSGKTSNGKGKKLKKPSGKRKEREESDDDDSEEEDCEQIAQKERMIKHLKKETIQAILRDFGEPTNGKKAVLAKEATLMLTCDPTDSDDEDDEDDD